VLSILKGKSGEIEFDAVKTESHEMNNRVTFYAVEEGQDVSDHVSIEPDSLPISGVIVGQDAKRRKDLLIAFRNNKELLTYIGKENFANGVIESLTIRHSARVSDGFEFDITLRRVRITQVREVQIAITPEASTQTKSVQSKGTQQVKKKDPYFTFKPRGNA